jgi:hypothetical protein
MTAIHVEERGAMPLTSLKWLRQICDSPKDRTSKPRLCGKLGRFCQKMVLGIPWSGKNPVKFTVLEAYSFHMNSFLFPPYANGF